mgnify:CR=1 FL=1
MNFFRWVSAPKPPPEPQPDWSASPRPTDADSLRTIRREVANGMADFLRRECEWEQLQPARPALGLVAVVGIPRPRPAHAREKVPLTPAVYALPRALPLHRRDHLPRVFRRVRQRRRLQLCIEPFRSVLPLREAFPEFRDDFSDPPEPGLRQGEDVFFSASAREASVISRAYSLSSTR